MYDNTSNLIECEKELVFISDDTKNIHMITLLTELKKQVNFGRWVGDVICLSPVQQNKSPNLM